MSATIDQSKDLLWTFRVRGVLKKSDLRVCQDRYVSEVNHDGRAGMLILIEAFEGLEHGVAWDDLEFFFAHGDTLNRMAIVGDPRLEPEVMALRRMPVRYFAHYAEPAAREWLGQTGCLPPRRSQRVHRFK